MSMIRKESLDAVKYQRLAKDANLRKEHHQKRRSLSRASVSRISYFQKPKHEQLQTEASFDEYEKTINL